MQPNPLLTLRRRHRGHLRWRQTRERQVTVIAASMEYDGQAVRREAAFERFQIKRLNVQGIEPRQHRLIAREVFRVVRLVIEVDMSVWLQAAMHGLEELLRTDDMGQRVIADDQIELTRIRDLELVVVDEARRLDAVDL